MPYGLHKIECDETTRQKEKVVSSCTRHPRMNVGSRPQLPTLLAPHGCPRFKDAGQADAVARTTSPVETNLNVRWR